MKKLVAAYPRPENVGNLQIPKTNKDVWEELRPGYRIADGQVQRVQGLLAAMLSISLRMMDAVGTGDGGSLEQHLPQISDIVRGISASFSQLHQVRKETIRNDLGFPTGKFCSWDTPVAQETLFEGDFAKQATEKAQRKKLRKSKNFK